MIYYVKQDDGQFVEHTKGKGKGGKGSSKSSVSTGSGTGGKGKSKGKGKSSGDRSVVGPLGNPETPWFCCTGCKKGWIFKATKLLLSAKNATVILT